MNSPVDDSGAEAGKEKSMSESPANTMTTFHSKLQPSPLSQSALTQKASPQKITSSPSANSSNTLLNGNKRSHVTDTTSSPTPASTLPPKKRRRVSRSTSPSMQKSRSKPIISPVRCLPSSKVAASSGDSYSDTSLPSPVENGIPQQYLRDFSKHASSGDGSKSRSRHHHRRHHHHSSSKSHRDHHPDRRHHRRREEEPGERGRRDYHTSSSSSKSRRTEPDRYR